MAEVDHSKGDVMRAQKTRIIAFKANQQALELVNPREGAFRAKAMLVDICVEVAFASSFGLLAITNVFRNIGDQAVIEADFARFTGVKGLIGIEIASLNHQTEALQVFERRLEMLFQVVGIVVIARDDTRARDHIAVPVHYRQNVTRFAFLAMLIGD
jgi:hypothetical protein